MNWKYALIPIIVVIGFLAVVLFYPVEPPAETPEENVTHFYVSITYSDYGIADYGFDKVGYVSLNVDIDKADGNLSVLWFANQPRNKVYLLDYPAVEVSDYSTFSSLLLQRFNEYNVDIKHLSIGSVFSVQNSVIIVPTGRIPSFLFKNLSAVLENNNVILYVGKDTSLLLEPDGSQVPNTDQISFQPGTHGNYTITPIGDDLLYTSSEKGVMYIIPRPLNSFTSLQSAVEKIVNTVLKESWQNVTVRDYHIGPSYHGGLTLISPPITSDSGYVRVIYNFRERDGDNTACGTITSGYLKSYSGRLHFLDTDVFPSEKPKYEIDLNESYDKPIKLTLYLMFKRDGELLQNFTVTVDSITVRNIWKSTYTLDQELPPGNYIVILKDQFNQVHALGYLHVKNFTITLADVKGDTYFFNVSVDGRALESATVKVWIDGKYFGEQPVSSGTLTITAGLPRADHVIKLEYKGAAVTGSFSTKRAASVLDIYLKYGPIGMLIVVVVYLMFRAKPRPIYTLHVPSFVEETFVERKISKKDLLNVFKKVEKEYGWKNLPLSFREVKNGIAKYALPNERVVVLDTNLMEVLNSLIDEGDIVAYNDYYLPKSWLKGSDIKTRVVYRKARDLVIAHGLPFDERGDYLFIPSKNVAILPYKENVSRVIASLMKKGVDHIYLVFANDTDKDDYLKKVFGPDKDTQKLAIMVKLDVIIPVTVSELGDYL
ncbi:hypothetical protein J7K41_01525 [Candidatus Micrarchaeota archaeon]|nr:hypothetical protein [Candidatus Micrarchaeota archaeon]